MDAELKHYLDLFAQKIEIEIKSAVEQIHSVAEGIYKKIEGTDCEVNRNKDSIDELYKLHRETDKTLGKMDGRIKVLEDDKTDHKSNKVLIVTISLAAVGWIVAIVLAIISMSSP